MSRPRLLDLFCGAGGAAMGYHRAGFDVVGVDIAPQPQYPFEFYRQDAMDVLALYDGGYHHFDAIHASPPCQFYSEMSACRPGLRDTYPELITPLRPLLQATGRPYVIENVPRARSFLRDPAMLCGAMFDLDLYRHRLFETNAPLPLMMHPGHGIRGGRAGHWKQGEIVSVSGNCAPIRLVEKGMGIDWMTRNELREAVPPAYTEWIGLRLLEALRVPVTATVSGTVQLS